MNFAEQLQIRAKQAMQIASAKRSTWTEENYGDIRNTLSLKAEKGLGDCLLIDLMRSQTCIKTLVKLLKQDGFYISFEEDINAKQAPVDWRSKVIWL